MRFHCLYPHPLHENGLIFLQQPPVKMFLNGNERCTSLHNFLKVDSYVHGRPNNKLSIKQLANVKRGNFVTHVLETSARRVRTTGPARFKFVLREPKKHLLKPHTESKRGLQHIFRILIYVAETISCVCQQLQRSKCWWGQCVLVMRAVSKICGNESHPGTGSWKAV